MTTLDWSRSHGDTVPDNFVIPRASAAPPALGGGAASADASAADGGVSGFSLRRTAWDVMAGQGASMSDLREFINELDTQPDLRAAALLRSLERVRKELDRCPEDAPLSSPVQLTLQDTVVLARALLQRLR